jgi:hypothetical protein
MGGGIISLQVAASVGISTHPMRICYAPRMPWTDSFWKPIKLNDGRALTTLGDARELISTLPPAA